MPANASTLEFPRIIKPSSSCANISADFLIDCSSFGTICLSSEYIFTIDCGTPTLCNALIVRT